MSTPTTPAVSAPDTDATTPAPLLGEVITWEVAGVTVRHAHLRDALADAGLDPTLARTICPRNAFIRAARKLVENRIIRKVDETPEAVRFQFTSEVRDTDHLRYDLETILTLDKVTGALDCPDPAILARASAAFTEAMEARTGNDVSQVVFRLFADKKKADLDLIPLRDAGGVYFVRADRRDFVNQVEDFLSRLHCRMNRFPVASGTAAGDACVRDAVAAKMSALIGDLDAAVEDFGEDTTERVIKSAAERVAMLKFKIESYATYLDDERERLETSLADAQARLRKKASEIGSAKAPLLPLTDEPAPAPVTKPEPEPEPVGADLFSGWPEANRV